MLYTGDGADDRSIPHALGVAPDFVLIKGRDGTGRQWIGGHSAIDIAGNEFFKIDEDPHESKNLASNAKHAEALGRYKKKLKAQQQKFHDPWVMKWSYE